MSIWSRSMKCLQLLCSVSEFVQTDLRVLRNEYVGRRDED